ncbi:MAG: hypothetical protein JSS76_11300 [Bacteroidetes bacterium]|nr:hypothetical protein [Bacteroidota bacterium]
MKKIFGSRIHEWLICCLIFSISYLFFYPVVDDYSFFASSLAAHQFSDFSYFDFHWQGYIGIREIYKAFYYLLPQVNWHYVFSILTEFAGLYLLLRVLRTIALDTVRDEWLIISLQVLFGLLYIQDIISVSHTRVSIIFCGVAVYRLAFLQRPRRQDTIADTLLYITGLLLRPESSIGTLLLAGTGLLLFTLDIRYTLRRLWIPASIVIVFLALFAIDLQTTDIYVRQIEPEIEYKVMADRMLPLSAMQTPQDSVKREALKIGMWFDTRGMSPAYMRSILLPGGDFSPAHSLAVFYHVYGFYKYYSFIDVFIVLLLLLSVLAPQRDWGSVWRMMVFSIFSFLVIYLLDYNGFLVCDRHFLNLQFTSLLILSYFFFHQPGIPGILQGAVRLGIGLCVAFVFLCFTIARYAHDNKNTYADIEAAEQMMKKIESRYSGRLVISTIDGRFLFDQHFSVWNHNYTANRYILYDWFTFASTPRYVDYLSRSCGCDAADPAALFRWFAGQKALYLAVPYRSALTSRYMQTVYGCDVYLDDPVRVNDLVKQNNIQTEDLELRTVKLRSDTARSGHGL